MKLTAPLRSQAWTDLRETALRDVDQHKKIADNAIGTCHQGPPVIAFSPLLTLTF
jgi:hypothetical protein